MGNYTKNLTTIFLTFFKIGLFTFGGGFAMIPLIEQEIVAKRKWIDKEKFVDAISITQSVPGAVAINLSIYFGYSLAGVIGALVATLGVALPSFIIIILIAFGFKHFSQHQLVANIFKGIRPAVVGLIFYAGIELSSNIDWSAAIITTFILTLGANLFFGINPAILIIMAIVVSVVVYLKSKQESKQGKETGEEGVEAKEKDTQAAE